MFQYSVAIRTLGKSGVAYETMIHCLKKQTIPPTKIVVYIAEGYSLPDRVSDEIYVYSKKGMAYQRALPYDEISTEFILLCDDDVYFAEDAVEKLFKAMQENQADCISPNVFPNHEMRLRMKIIKAMLYGECPSYSKRYAFRIRNSANYSYCNNPYDVMESQVCAGPCMLVKKEVNNALDYMDEVWMDQFPYTSGQDQLFSYKLYRYGYKIIIHYNVGIIHLDAQTGHIQDIVQSDFNKRKIRYIEWYRSLYEPARCGFQKIVLSLSYYLSWLLLFLWSLLSFVLGRNRFKLKNSLKALIEARKYVNSSEYSKLPKWKVVR